MAQHALLLDALTVLQPLQSLPSMLAIRDIRRRIAASRPDLRDRGVVADLLALDPLSCLRVLRFANAPMFGPPRQASAERAVGVRELVDGLGTSAVLRTLDVPVVEPDRTRRLRELWLHSLATACAARRLAVRFGSEDPEIAYLRGLLHDLTAWLQLLGQHHNGAATNLDGHDLARRWNLPLDDSTLGPIPQRLSRALASRTPPSPAELIALAESLAEHADFRHPDSPEPCDRSASLAASAQDVLVEAHEIAHEVEARLTRFGLDRKGCDDAGGSHRFGNDEDATLFQGRTRGEAYELVLGVLTCRAARTYREIESMVCAAALRHLDLDRAFLVGVDLDSGRAFLRSKADLSRRHVPRRAIQPTRTELDLLRDAATSSAARILVRSEPPAGLCGTLASDRALAIPIPTERTPALFLVADRALTGRVLDLDVDGTAASALASCSSLLFENLELRHRRARAERDALTDPLTRLANRGYGLARLNQAIAGSRRTGQPLSLIMADLDEFKQLNDTLGHLEGDRALRIAADVLRKTCRQSDTVCRYGGEEFLVVLPDIEASDATILATRLFTAVADAGERAGLPLTISIGLSALRDEDDVDALVGRADRALYASKSRGRNRFSVDT